MHASEIDDRFHGHVVLASTFVAEPKVVRRFVEEYEHKVRQCNCIVRNNNNNNNLPTLLKHTYVCTILADIK